MDYTEYIIPIVYNIHISFFYVLIPINKINLISLINKINFYNYSI